MPVDQGFFLDFQKTQGNFFHNSRPIFVITQGFLPITQGIFVITQHFLSKSLVILHKIPKNFPYLKEFLPITQYFGKSIWVGCRESPEKNPVVLTYLEAECQKFPKWDIMYLPCKWQMQFGLWQWCPCPFRPWGCPGSSDQTEWPPHVPAVGRPKCSFHGRCGRLCCRKIRLKG